MGSLIKICGITNSEDAMKCVELDVDFLGFIFAESPRKISIETAKKIIAQLPKAIRTVAVFKNQPLTHVKSILERIPFDLVQLHGDEDMNYINAINAAVIKSFDMTDKKLITKLEAYRGIIPLLDLPKESSAKIPVDIARTISFHFPIMQAGKINAKNVKTIINQIRPWCIDICSGVEKEVSKKDHRLMEELFNTIHQCSFMDTVQEACAWP